MVIGLIQSERIPGWINGISHGRLSGKEMWKKRELLDNWIQVDFYGLTVTNVQKLFKSICEELLQLNKLRRIYDFEFRTKKVSQFYECF